MQCTEANNMRGIKDCPVQWGCYWRFEVTGCWGCLLLHEYQFRDGRFHGRTFIYSMYICTCIYARTHVRTHARVCTVTYYSFMYEFMHGIARVVPFCVPQLHKPVLSVLGLARERYWSEWQQDIWAVLMWKVGWQWICSWGHPTGGAPLGWRLDIAKSYLP